MKASLLKINHFLLFALVVFIPLNSLKGQKLPFSDKGFQDDNFSTLFKTFGFNRNSQTLREFDAMGCIDLGSGSFKATLYTLGDISESHTHISQMSSPRVIEHLKVKKTPIKDLLKLIHDELFELTGSIEAEFQSKYKLDKKPKVFWEGVATEVFRSHDDFQKYFQSIKEGHNIHIKIISQKEEAHLSYYFINMLNKKSDKGSSHVIALDIGGGSTQISWDDKTGESHLNHILLPYGGTSFKNELSNLLFGEVKDTVNPIIGQDTKISKDIKEQKLMEIFNHFKVSLLKNERSNSIGKFKELSTQKSVYAIGGLINNSVCPVACSFGKKDDKPVIYLSKLKNSIMDSMILDDASLLKNLSSKNDKKFVNIAVSNLILLYTYMRLLGIDRIHAIEANLDTVLIKMKEQTHLSQRYSKLSFNEGYSKRELLDNPFEDFMGLCPNI